MTINMNRTKAYVGQLTANGQMRNTFEATIPHGQTLADITDGTYWWRVSRQMRAFDEIRCIWEDGSRVCQLRILDRDDKGQTVFVVPVPGMDFEYSPPDLPKGYELKFINDDIGWQVFRTKGQAPLQSGFKSAIAAARWLQADMGEEDEAPAARAPAPKPTGGTNKSSGAKDEAA